MGLVKISELDIATALTGAETGVLVQAGTTKKNNPSNLGNIRVRGESGVNPMHPDFGAVGDGVTDDIVALERARDYCLTGSLTTSPSDPATTIRTPLYPLMLTRKHKVSRPFKLYSTSQFKMIGNGGNTGLLGAAGQVNVLDINGNTWSHFTDFSVNGPATTGNVDAVIDYYWDNRTAARSTSGSTFENIQIGGRFIHGFGVSRLSYLISGGAPQVDQTKFDQVVITGQSQSDATLWQSAYRLGNGVSGNQTNYWFIGGGGVYCKYGFHGSGVKTLLVLGGSYGAVDTLVYNNGMYDFTMTGTELEDVQRLYDAIGATAGTNRVTFENIEHAFVTVPADGKFVKYYQGGTFTLRGYRQSGFPGGTQPNLGMTFFQFDPNEMTVILDGVQLLEPLDTVMNWSGPIRALVQGYTHLSKTTFNTLDHIAGPLYLTGNAAEIAHRVRQTADTTDRWSVDANGVIRVGATGFLEMSEMASDPAAPAANKARLFTRDNGSGKTQACIRFPTGAIQVLATEP